MTHKKTILVDFDGVLHSYTSGWKGEGVIPDPPNTGAIEWLWGLLDDERFEVCIYSSRSKTSAGIDAMDDWLRKHGLDGRTHELRFPTTKPAAFLTIDDRAFVFRGRFPSLDEIAAFEPWKSGDRTDGFGVSSTGELIKALAKIDRLEKKFGGVEETITRLAQEEGVDLESGWGLGMLAAEAFARRKAKILGVEATGSGQKPEGKPILRDGKVIGNETTVAEWLGEPGPTMEEFGKLTALYQDETRAYNRAIKERDEWKLEATRWKQLFADLQKEKGQSIGEPLTHKLVAVEPMSSYEGEILRAEVDRLAKENDRLQLEVALERKKLEGPVYDSATLHREYTRGAEDERARCIKLFEEAVEARTSIANVARELRAEHVTPKDGVRVSRKAFDPITVVEGAGSLSGRYIKEEDFLGLEATQARQHLWVAGVENRVEKLEKRLEALEALEAKFLKTTEEMIERMNRVHEMSPVGVGPFKIEWTGLPDPGPVVGTEEILGTDGVVRTYAVHAPTKEAFGPEGEE